MTAIASHLSTAELEARYETAADPIGKSHFHAIWLLSLNYGVKAGAIMAPMLLALPLVAKPK
jgi:hypothetical protein